MPTYKSEFADMMCLTDCGLRCTQGEFAHRIVREAGEEIGLADPQATVADPVNMEYLLKDGDRPVADVVCALSTEGLEMEVMPCGTVAKRTIEAAIGTVLARYDRKLKRAPAQVLNTT